MTRCVALDRGIADLPIWRVPDGGIIALWRGNSAHLPRPWCAIGHGICRQSPPFLLRRVFRWLFFSCAQSASWLRALVEHLRSSTQPRPITHGKNRTAHRPSHFFSLMWPTAHAKMKARTPRGHRRDQVSAAQYGQPRLFRRGVRTCRWRRRRKSHRSAADGQDLRKISPRQTSERRQARHWIAGALVRRSRQSFESSRQARPSST